MPSSLRKIAHSVATILNCFHNARVHCHMALLFVCNLNGFVACMIYFTKLYQLSYGLPLRRDGIKGQDGKTGKDYDPRDTSKLTLGVVRGPVFALGISVSLNPAVSTLKVKSYNIGIIILTVCNTPPSNMQPKLEGRQGSGRAAPLDSSICLDSKDI